jgi:hypothetical protein
MRVLDKRVGDDWGLKPAGGWRPSAKGRLTLFVAVSTLILVAVTVVWTLFLVRAFDYDAAYKCSSTPNPACYTERPDEVQSVGTDNTGKNAQAYIVLQYYGRFELTTTSGLWSVAHAGDPAVVRIYHGAVVTIEARGATAETSGNPNMVVKHVTGFEIAALGLLLGCLAIRARERFPRFTPCARIYAAWAFVSGAVVGLAVGNGPLPVWAGFSAASLIVGILIGTEFFVLRPRIAAREAEEAGDTAG